MPEVNSFCQQYAAEVHADGISDSSDAKGCIWSELYAVMKRKCGPTCFKTTYACLTPQSYCVKVGNEKDAISRGLAYYGDSSGMLDSSRVKTFDDGNACDDYCLKSTEFGIQLRS